MCNQKISIIFDAIIVQLWAEQQRQLSAWCCGVVVITKKCGDHEIFIMKIFNYGIFSNFMKILNHENLELYGTCSQALRGQAYMQSSSCSGKCLSVIVIVDLTLAWVVQHSPLQFYASSCPSDGAVQVYAHAHDDHYLMRSKFNSLLTEMITPQTYIYRTLAKEGPWVVHLTLGQDWGMGRYSRYQYRVYTRKSKLPTLSS